jgi:RNA polymerase sigma factor (sigma-70 family)
MSAAERIDLADCYRQQRTELIRLAFLLSGDRELAEDVVHAVFADVQSRWGSVIDARAYLRRAVTNRVKDAQRRRFRQPTVPDERAVTGIPDLDETWHAVRRLPPAQRHVVVLHFYEDMTLVDIAALLDRKPATVRSDLHRALATLKGTIRD